MNQQNFKTVCLIKQDRGPGFEIWPHWPEHVPRAPYILVDVPAEAFRWICEQVAVVAEREADARAARRGR